MLNGKFSFVCRRFIQQPASRATKIVLKSQIKESKNFQVKLQCVLFFGIKERLPLLHPACDFIFCETFLVVLYQQCT
jgi:hypothetical protein